MAKEQWDKQGDQWWLITQEHRFRGVVNDCAYCGRPFPSLPSKKRRFCSNLCSQRGQPRRGQTRQVVLDMTTALMAPKSNEYRWASDTDGYWWELRRGQPYTRVSSSICAECGKEFWQRPSRGKRFCSRECSGKEHGRVLLAKRDGKPGSKFKDSYGYVQVYFPEHPMAKRSHTVSEHRIVMEGVLGRYLFPYENVHHKDGDRANNDPSNLELWITPQPAGQRAIEIKHCPTCTCNNTPMEAN